jgi:hypothetical protein
MSSLENLVRVGQLKQEGAWIDSGYFSLPAIGHEETLGDHKNGSHERSVTDYKLVVRLSGLHDLRCDAHLTLGQYNSWLSAVVAEMPAQMSFHGRAMRHNRIFSAVAIASAGQQQIALPGDKRQ